MIAKSTERVTQNTDPHINEDIRRRMQMRVAYFRQHPNEIPRRLDELDREWDIERLLATNSSAITLTGLVLSQVKGKRWLLLSLAVQGFFLQHALTGWCPPLPVMRKLGFRTPKEIEDERHALMQIRAPVANGHSRAASKRKHATAGR